MKKKRLIQSNLFSESDIFRVGDKVEFINPVPFHDTQKDLYISKILEGKWVILRRLDRRSNYHCNCSINSIQKKVIK